MQQLGRSIWATRSKVAARCGVLLSGWAFVGPASGLPGTAQLWGAGLLVVVAAGSVPLQVIVTRRSARARGGELPVEGPGPGWLNEEVDRVRRPCRVWWQDEAIDDSSTLDERLENGFFKLWTAYAGLDARALVYDVGPIEVDARYRAPASAHPASDDLRRKAALVRAAGMLSGQNHRLEVRPQSWELTQWAQDHHADFIRDNRNIEISAFGAPGAEPHPGILGTHSVVLTADDWLLLCRRSDHTTYHPWHWSASMEEQVDIGTVPDLGVTPDTSVLDTIERGLLQELGIDKNAIATARSLGIGVECTLTGRQHVMAPSVISIVRLNIDRRQLWALIDDPARAVDHHENDAWLAISVRSAADAWTALSATGTTGPGHVAPSVLNDAGIATHMHPRSAAGADLLGAWHPTSRVRLLLLAHHLDR